MERHDGSIGASLNTKNLSKTLLSISKHNKLHRRFAASSLALPEDDMNDTAATVAAPLPRVAIETITGIQLAMMRTTDPGRRGQHPKQHGCVWAHFEVLTDIPEA